MYFWWSSNVSNYLFPDCNINSIPIFVITCISLILLGFILEWLKLLQSKLQQTEIKLRSRQLRTVCPSTESSTLIDEDARNVAVITLRERVLFSLSDIVLWLFSFNISYFAMLIIMLFNGWFMISILIGSCIGYFIFGRSLAKINLENYKIIRQTYCIYSCPEAGPSSRNGESTPALEAHERNRPCHSVSSNVTY